MKKLFLSVLILCLAGLVGEIYLRAFDPQPTFRWYSYDQSGNRWNKGVSDTYFLLVPDLKGYITFNSRGERAEQNFSLMKNSEAKRVLLLGTSLTMGWPANRGVSELLTERFSKSGEKADVINCSTGYSNLATLLNVYKVHCPYESLDALVVAVPLNAFVDGLAANSFLWGENFIDDPSKLAYLLRYSEPSKIQLSHDESGVPSFVLSEAEQAKVADYYTGSWFFYDHFHLARLIYNRYVYTSIVFDKTFQRNYKDYFDRSFKSMPTLDTTYGLVDRFRKMAGPQTKLIVLLIPTYHAMILEPSTREKVIL